MLMKKRPKATTWVFFTVRLVQIIEEIREELVELGTEKGLHDPEVIQLSRKLDEFINAFYRKRKRIACGSKIRILRYFQDPMLQPTEEDIKDINDGYSSIANNC